MTSLEPSLSPARLGRYAANTGGAHSTVVNYLCNVELCASLYYSLNAVEIALRNGLHRSLTHHIGVPNWFDGHGLLEPAQLRDVQAVRARIQGRGEAATPDRIVSELTFGFWVVILSRPYDARFWSANNASALKGAFLRLPRQYRRRQFLHQRFNSIRELRNRVMHHEPLFDDRMLALRHRDTYQALHWLNPAMVDVCSWFDQFPDVHANGRKRVDSTLTNRIGSN